MHLQQTWYSFNGRTSLKEHNPICSIGPLALLFSFLLFRWKKSFLNSFPSHAWERRIMRICHQVKKGFQPRAARSPDVKDVIATWRSLQIITCAKDISTQWRHLRTQRLGLKCDNGGKEIDLVAIIMLSRWKKFPLWPEWSRRHYRSLSVQEGGEQERAVVVIWLLIAPTMAISGRPLTHDEDPREKTPVTLSNSNMEVSLNWWAQLSDVTTASLFIYFKAPLHSAPLV